MATIDTIGMGVREARKLRKAGVRTTQGLLKRAAIGRGRTELSRATGLSTKQLLGWANRADLMRVKGIGAEYADLLKGVGVDTIRELRRRNPKSLTAALTEANESKRTVQRLPTEAMVAGWISYAEDLEPTVKR